MRWQTERRRNIGCPYAVRANQKRHVSPVHFRRQTAKGSDPLLYINFLIHSLILDSREEQFHYLLEGDQSTHKHQH
ncbi:hypothetical protein NPIL_297621 [Nephila pilipes]|uniref:Uncharacterized protein n=1 Tax=Nephila pilipes TaxID=299642 RepID=A0A8X6QR51_NEPPI|nr:hypothetical protein NPIL_297621 [Nephila pilipes]